jgi:hypothetical protein
MQNIKQFKKNLNCKISCYQIVLGAFKFTSTNEASEWHGEPEKGTRKIGKSCREKNQKELSLDHTLICLIECFTKT